MQDWNDDANGKEGPLTKVLHDFYSSRGVNNAVDQTIEKFKNIGNNKKE